MAPVVVKLSKGGASGRSDAGGRNAAHIRYVATHDAQPGRRDATGPNAAHIEYQATHDAKPDREGRLLVGNAAEAGLAAAMKEAAANKGHQWRWIVSLRGDDAERLGYRQPEDWHRLAHELAGRMGAAIGIAPEDVRWVAAHHDPEPAAGRPRHPHLHLAIWSATPVDRPHRLSRDELRQVRRSVVQAIHGPERSRLGQTRTQLRQQLRRSSDAQLRQALDRARRGRWRRWRFLRRSEPRQELASRLRALGNELPGRGRLALAYQAEPIRQQARETADWLLRQPQVHDQLAQFRETARQQAALYTSDPIAQEQAVARAYDDLRDRVAQDVLRASAQARWAESAHHTDQVMQSAVGSLARGIARALAADPKVDPIRRRELTRRGREDQAERG